jgi:DNA-binding MarR family transcriptional regulator
MVSILDASNSNVSANVLAFVPKGRVIKALPPSAKLIYRALDDRGALTSRELSDETYLAPRTVRHALKRLKNFGLVHTRNSLRDSRTSYFYLGERCERL